MGAAWLLPEPWLLPVALILFGASSGAMDVSMNSHGVAVERARRADRTRARATPRSPMR